MLMNKLSDEAKRIMIRDIQQFFEEERGETLGQLAAENVLSFVCASLGPVFYNQAIEDARAAAEQKMQSLEEDLYSLQYRLK